MVEGRYDKNTLSQVIDANIIETCGFGIFRDGELLSLLRRLSAKDGLIILTDSDGAGFLIRNYLKGAIKGGDIKHAYVPDMPGKERRKRSASSEGKLGVEGMSAEILLTALRRAGATFLESPNKNPPERKITKADLYALGLSGGKDSANRRALLLKRLDLPERLQPNGLLDILNALYGYDKFMELAHELLG